MKNNPKIHTKNLIINMLKIQALLDIYRIDKCDDENFWVKIHKGI